MSVDQIGPGWFPDPWRLAPWRWWDGYRWAPHTWPPAELVDARRKETSLLKWAKLGLTSMLVSAAGGWVYTVTVAVNVRSTMDQNSFGQPVVFTQQTGWWSASYLISTIALGVAVVFLTWQHSAATVARGLGYPAHHSPSMGVGSWFIPVVNFWFPYQALSDMLPPDHPMRPLCLRAWLAWLGVAAVNAVAFFLALTSTTAAVVALSVSGVFVIYAFVTGRRLIDAVYQDHTRRLAH